MKRLFDLTVLLAALGWVLAGQASAQTFATLHAFTPTATNSLSVLTNSNGASPYAGLTASTEGKTYYSTASLGGSAGYGTVFAVRADGADFTILHSFVSSDGANPWAGLILSGRTLFGTTTQGGSSGAGTVFAINTDGTGFTNLHHFTTTSASEINSDGAYPNAELILYGNTLYGTASKGGSAGLGTVFAVGTNGTRFTVLHSFAGGSDGAVPVAGLILSGNTLYGTASGGGAGGNGAVFAVQVDGTGFTVLHAFERALCFTDNDCPPGYQCGGPGICVCHGFCGGLRGGDNGWGTPPLSVNFEGANPNARLLLLGSALYGTAADCGSSGHGTVFAVATNGIGFSVLHTFTGGVDGANPWAGLILSGNTTLYGTAYSGGAFGHGTVFAVNADGSGFTSLYGFTGGSDGAGPIGGLLLSGNTLSGTAELGGSSGNGAVYSISFTPN
jgi:uncharacterized repeat protein (TIGR03803 family)